ncbi:MAG: hypothetical protein WAX77_03015, partial [Methylococcaceae bacterium]
MAKRAESGEVFWGYSINTCGQIIASLLEAPRYIGRDKLIELILDSGESIFCTPDHEFLNRDGRMVQAGNLRVGASLMPLYRSTRRGYEMIYQTSNNRMYPTHRLADEWNLRHGVYEEMTGTHRHHIDGQRRNNYPWNITRMNASEHLRYHNSKTYGEGFDAKAHGESVKAAYARNAQNPQWKEKFSQGQRERALGFWHRPEYAQIRERVLAQRQNPTEATRQAHSEAMIKRYADPQARAQHAELMKQAWSNDTARKAKQAEIARYIKYREEITADVVRKALDETGSIRGAARLLECDRSVFRRFPEELNSFRGTTERRNHKIAQIREVAGEHDVYCLTAPEAGNFALEAGVFVSNCGIIVNVTPLEPCFSSDTEILTKNGWKYFNEIVIGSEVLTMNPQTREAQWQNVERIQAYTYRGDLLHFNSRGVDLLVTPDHSLYVDKFDTTTHEWQGWHKTKAEKVFAQDDYRMSRHVNWQGTDIDDEIIIANTAYNTNSLLEFIGMYLT